MRMLLVTLGLWLSVGVSPATAAPFAWPQGQQAAVSLGYDDGLDSQLDHVVPALNRRGLKASFYVPINSPTVPGRMKEWTAAAAAGHELGNHTLFHACSGKAPGREWVQPHRDLETTLPAQVQEQVVAANSWLQALDGQTQRTFTPPCLDSRASGQDYLDALKPQFVAFRARWAALVTDPLALDPYAVPVYGVEGWTGEQLIALVEEAAVKGALVAVVFHGVGAEHLSVSREAHDALLDHLARHKARFWTDSFVRVMGHIRQQQGATTMRP
jgi:peptidoglycan/xylan/chitin deacetylase (PgdA/CDA1 family)